MTPEPLRAPRRAWRALFVAYALVLTTATHWPRLEIGSEAHPAPDKLLHLVAFAALAVLFWRARLVVRDVPFALVLWGWAIADEVTQGLPILGRETSLQDIAASLLGVTLVIAWRLALGPVGGPANRARLESVAYAHEHAFARRAAWVSFILHTALGLIVLGPLLLFVFSASLDGLLDAVVLAAALGGGVGAHLGLTAIWRREYDRLALRPPCPRCGAEAPPGDAPITPCPGCAAPLWSGRWPPRLSLPRGKLIRLARRPVLVAGGSMIALFAVYLAMVALHPVFPLVGRLTRAYHQLPSGLRLDLDLSLLALAAAAATRLVRRRLASVFDGQHRRCMHCDHDVHANPIENGAGRCAECGRPFHRPPEELDG